MGSVNRVTIIGRLGHDPSMRQSTAGNAIANLSIATDEKFKNSSGEWETRVEWHKATCFGKRAEAMAQYLSKGSQVYIEGSLQTRKWENKDGVTMHTTEIIVKTFEFLDSKAGNHTDGEQQDNDRYGSGKSQSAPTVEDQDVPF